MQRVRSIQYLRAVAALGVVAFHAMESTGNRFEVGAAGVDIFFIISGFIMASLMLGEEAKPGAFLWRRIVRIVPLYWLTTLAALAIALIKPNFFYRLDPSVENTLFSLVFIPHEGRNGGVAPVLWQGWTLEYEMFFYALCTAALALPFRNRLHYLAGVLVLLAAIGIAFAPANVVAGVYTNTLLLEFCAGIGLAGLWRTRALPKPWVGAVALALGFALLAAQQAALLPTLGERVIDWGVPAFLIVAGGLSLEAHDRVAHSSVGLELGEASYSIYLTHGFVVSAIVWWFADASPWVRVPASLIGAIVVAVACHRLVERPITNALRRAPLRLRGA